MEVVIKKQDADLQVVYGEVYAPMVPDSDGDFMTPVEVRKMAHKFMMNQRNDAVDTQHDNDKNGSFVVESFVAGKNDTDYLPEAWVVGVYVPDPDMWGKVKKGEINGFSFQGMVKSRDMTVEVELPDVLEGPTEKAEGHEHVFVIDFDDDGKFLGGYTKPDDSGHTHTIERGTVTSKADDANGKEHTHRYSFNELIRIL